MADNKEKVEDVKVEIDLENFNEATMLEVLETVLGKKVARVENYVFAAIKEAGNKTKVDTKAVKKGCGAKVIEEVVSTIWKKYDGK